jgi:hypothetical protein
MSIVISQNNNNLITQLYKLFPNNKEFDEYNNLIMELHKYEIISFEKKKNYINQNIEEGKYEDIIILLLVLMEYHQKNIIKKMLKFDRIFNLVNSINNKNIRKILSQLIKIYDADIFRIFFELFTDTENKNLFNLFNFEINNQNQYGETLLFGAMYNSNITTVYLDILLELPNINFLIKNTHNETILMKTVNIIIYNYNCFQINSDTLFKLENYSSLLSLSQIL